MTVKWQHSESGYIVIWTSANMLHICSSPLFFRTWIIFCLHSPCSSFVRTDDWGSGRKKVESLFEKFSWLAASVVRQSEHDEKRRESGEEESSRGGRKEKARSMVRHNVSDVIKYWPEFCYIQTFFSSCSLLPHPDPLNYMADESTWIENVDGRLMEMKNVSNSTAILIEGRGLSGTLGIFPSIFRLFFVDVNDDCSKRKKY